MFSSWRKTTGSWRRSWHPSEVVRPRQDPPPGCQMLSPGVERNDGTVDCDEQTLARLDEAIATSSAYLTEKWIATTTLINPMLEVWEAANAIHPTIARPVEELLTVLIHRTTITPAEINAVAHEVRTLALQASVLAEATKVS
jgi:hypothetical protein